MDIEFIIFNGIMGFVFLIISIYSLCEYRSTRDKFFLWGSGFMVILYFNILIAKIANDTKEKDIYFAMCFMIIVFVIYVILWCKNIVAVNAEYRNIVYFFKKK